MRHLLLVALVLSPALARADRFPSVSKGPTILGVTQTDAWVAWSTAHHQGKASGANHCAAGAANGAIPTLSLLMPDGAKALFTDAQCSRFHKVRLNGLKPGTAYRFTLDKPYPGGKTVEGGFTTAPATSEATVRFFVYGDNRENAVGQASTRPDHEALVKAMRAHAGEADFLLSSGDLSLNLPLVSGEDGGLTEFFDVERELLAQKPLAVAYGNHESIDTTFFDALFSAGALAGDKHPRYFSFDWGPAHLAVLDSYEGKANPLAGGQHSGAVSDAQAQWLDADLAAARGRGQQLFLLSHHGAYSHGNPAHGSSPDVVKKIVPLMIKHGVLGIFAGHDHYYERGREGCVGYYVVGAGGAPMYEPDPKAPGVLAARKTPSYLAVTVTRAGAKGEARDAKGEVFDRFDFEPARCDPPDAGAAPDAAAAPPARPAAARDGG